MAVTSVGGELPRILGYPIMLMFNMIQHVELAENSPSNLNSTHTFRTNWLGRFLYFNMNNHIKHHLYPQIPFHSLLDLHQEVAGQTPELDPGFSRKNYEAFSVAARRLCGGAGTGADLTAGGAPTSPASGDSGRFGALSLVAATLNRVCTRC